VEVGAEDDELVLHHEVPHSCVERAGVRVSESAEAVTIVLLVTDRSDESVCLPAHFTLEATVELDAPLGGGPWSTAPAERSIRTDPACVRTPGEATR
jgi:hypothetical protein